MKRTLWAIVLALALALGMMPLTAGAETDGGWQQIPTVPADCRVVMSGGLELTDVRAFYQGDPNARGAGDPDGMWLEYTAAGPAQVRDVCLAAVLETEPSPTEAAEAASEGIKLRAGQELPPRPLPIRGSESALFAPEERGKTMYWVLAGLDGSSALAGWAVVEFTAGEAEDIGAVYWGGRRADDMTICWTCAANQEGKSARLFLQGDISEEAPALAAVYNEQGKMLSASLLTREGSVSIAGGMTARVFWLYGDTWTPRIEQMTVPLNAIIE